VLVGNGHRFQYGPILGNQICRSGVDNTVKLAVAVTIVAIGCVSCTGQTEHASSVGRLGRSTSLTSTPTPTPTSPRSPVAPMPGADCVNAHVVQDPAPFVAMQVVGTSVWAVGGAGVWSSPDRGQHWYQRRVGGDLDAVDFVNGSHGWVVGGRQILATTDGGATWMSLPEPHCQPLRSVHFVSAADGFAAAGRPGNRGGYASDVLLETTDGGRSWQAQTGAPLGVETECFQDASTGWVGTAHGIYSTDDGGRSWLRIVRQPAGSRAAHPYVDLQCAGSGVTWALVDGLGAGMSQSPHIGWRLTTTRGTPLFGEQFFPHPGFHVKAQSAGSYPGPFSAISPTQAAYVDYCPACGAGTAPWLVAGARGGKLARKGLVRGLSDPFAGSFASQSAGCVSGLYRQLRHNRIGPNVARIVCTYDGGEHWLVTWERPAPT
jgi:hypothetical protein